MTALILFGSGFVVLTLGWLLLADPQIQQDLQRYRAAKSAREHTRMAPEGIIVPDEGADTTGETL